MNEPGRRPSLYVGANYHPHDSAPAQWERDIALMQEAGFTVVRLGHLAWDSYEPEDGRFEFAWFDDVVDRFHRAGIGVILDVPVRPAPLWLHRKHPGIDVVHADGTRQYAASRYLEDVGDPDYRWHALRFAGELVGRYADHPAVLAFGADNEPGDGPYSHSETVCARFVTWLEAKYGDLDALNRAWAGHRWSRRISDFAEIRVDTGSVRGAPERLLDFQRFVSDEVTDFHLALVELIEKTAPGVLVTGNAWYFSAQGRYFDYARVAYSGRMTRHGSGYYPGGSQRSTLGLYKALLVIARIQFESGTPHWATEAIVQTAAPGLVRKAAYASLLLGNQMLCGWTWQSMHAGEEQYLQGMLDWDGVPNRKYEEYRQLAAEFARIERFGFPYRPRPEIALAYSFPGQLASASFPEKHDQQLLPFFSAVLERNLDQHVIDVSRSDLDHQIVVVAGAAVMDDDSAARLRAFVARGGSLIMTSYSAVVEPTGQVFAITRPGLLADVFGIRVGSYQQPRRLNEVGDDPERGDHLDISYGDARITVESPRIDEIEVYTARVAASTVGLDRDYPVVTVNDHGEGRAIYIGLPARRGLIDAVLDEELDRRGIRPAVDVPPGVLARPIDDTHVLYVNLDGESKEITGTGPARSVLHDREHADGFILAPFDVEFVEFVELEQIGTAP